MAVDSARLERALTQRILLISHGPLPNHSRGHRYIVLGSTGNDYRVETHEDSDTMTCSCPDHRRRKVDCKHILFVTCRVLNRDIPESRPFDRHDYEQDNIDDAIDELQDERLTRNSRRGQTVISETAVPQKALADDPCAICLEDFVTGEDVVFCKKTCGSNLHATCYERWSRVSRKRACPLCRAPF